MICPSMDQDHPCLNEAHRIFVYFVSQKNHRTRSRPPPLALGGMCPFCPNPPPLVLVIIVCTYMQWHSQVLMTTAKKYWGRPYPFHAPLPFCLVLVLTISGVYINILFIAIVTKHTLKIFWASILGVEHIVPNSATVVAPCIF